MCPLNKQLFACIDLGTNTFHLLVGYWDKANLEVVYRERHFVKIAGDGIETIGPEPMMRALKAAESLGESLSKYNVKASAAYGTAALRTASNGPALKSELEERLRIPIQIIDGKREAALIANGVLAAGLQKEERYLIMDIGGGSVEFIIVEKGVTCFSESFPIGAQVLRQAYHKQEPFRTSKQPSLQEAALFDHLELTLSSLRAAIGVETKLVGASGTFDVLGDLFGKPVTGAVKSLPSARVLELYEEAARMDEAKRINDNRLPADRADMIVVALALIVYVLRICPQESIYTCDYALKEGALLEMARAN